jgi:GNAT superfamily N-acetyltransferase
MLETDTTKELSLRPALPDEARLLSDLALRSKSHWGYDADFLKACRAELTLSPDYIAASPVFVLEERKRIVGFYGLLELDGELELLYFFVEPAAINRGFGRRLWSHAVKTAARLGFQRLSIESDPYAEAFYQAMGAERVGEVPSSIKPERRLPLLKFHLV